MHIQIGRIVLLSASIISAALVIASVLGFGRFSIVTNDRGLAYRMDKFSGAVWLCTPQACKELPERQAELDFDKLSGS